MGEKKQLFAAVAISVIGVVFLFVVSQFIRPDAVNMAQIDETFIGRAVLVEGEVTSISAGENRTVMHLDDSRVSVVVFSHLNISKGDKAKVTGIVEEYNEKLQIRADKVEKNLLP